MATGAAHFPGSNMKRYLWTDLSNSQPFLFNSADSVIVFDETVDAANVMLSRTELVEISYDGKNVQLDVDVATLTSGNFYFQNGGLIIFGDNSVASASDQGPNVIIGSDGADQLFGLDGNDTLSGGTGYDRLLGGAGDDSIDGGDDDDILDGDAGNDILSAGAGNDELYGGDDNDTLLGGAGIDWLAGGSGDDRIDGGDSDDRLIGDLGDDDLSGGSGDDTLDGGAGDDTMDGGAGVEVAVFSDTYASAQIIYDADGWVTIITASGGTDRLKNVEYAQFKGKKISLGADAAVTNVAPVMTSGAFASTSENVLSGTPIYTVSATDTDANTSLIYSIAGGPDQALFQINAITGAVTFLAPPDFEHPADAGGDNVYEIVVQASDGSKATTKAVAIFVTDLNDNAPTISSAASGAVSENIRSTTPVHRVIGIDADAGASLSYFISGGADANLFNIDSSTGVVTFKASPDFEVDGDAGADNVYDIMVRAYDGALYTDKAVALTITNVSEPDKTGKDFNGDGKGDVLLQNVKDGSCFVWEMDGLALKSGGAGFVGWAAGKDWQVKATGDFNADGKSDILLQNAVDGACYVWEMDGLALKSGGDGFVGWAAGKDWQVKATGDFDGDGKSDILLQNKVDGACYVWEMDGLALKAGDAGFVGWAAGKDWQVKGTGDFDGDGKSDILLQNAVDGACYVWEMDGLTFKTGGAGYVGWAAGKDWQVKGTADFNGDGKSDILLQNAVDGACYVWQMDGRALKTGGHGFIGWAPGKDWQVASSGDFNGDEKGDILLQNAVDGACYVWEMDGLSLKSGGNGFVGWATGTDWHVAA